MEKLGPQPCKIRISVLTRSLVRGTGLEGWEEERGLWKREWLGHLFGGHQLSTSLLSGPSSPPGGWSSLQRRQEEAPEC